MQPGMNNRFQNEHIILIAILLLALVNGLLYIIIMPPWQHYDESNHFEYIWLWAERGIRPKPGDYNSEMYRDVAQSLIEHDFFPAGAALPDLTSEKPWIGRFSQLNEPPLYYLLGSILLRILPIENVDYQLYAARLVSLTLFLITILAGYGLVAEITPAGHPLRFLVPLTMALLPGLADLMTAVNNDVGAIAIFSLFLWGCVRLVQRGPSWQTLLWVVITSALCLFTKRSVYLALPSLGIALLFAFLRGRFRVLAWVLLIVSAFVGIFAVFSWGDAALWYRDTLQNYPTRNFETETPVERAAFRLNVRPDDPAVKLVQIIPPQTASQLSGSLMTLGAWIWASEPIEGLTPRLRFYDGSQIYGERISITKNPQFFALHLTPQGNTQRAWVTLEPIKKSGNPKPVEIYFDGIILAEGTFPVDQAPQFDENGSSGTWGGLPFENLLRNPSAETGWFYLRPWADKLLSLFFKDYEGQESFSLTVYSLIDLRVTKGYYRTVLVNLLRTFWAKFGWAHVPLEGGKSYTWILFPVTVLASVGVGLAIWQRRHRFGKLPWESLLLLGLTLFLFWGLTLVRGSTYLLTRVYVPVARYAYPAIIPSALFLSTGWYTLLEAPTRWLGLPGWVKYLVYIGFFILLNIYALLSIARFYQ